MNIGGDWHLNRFTEITESTVILSYYGVHYHSERYPLVHWFLSLREEPAGSLVSITPRRTRWFIGFYHSERYPLVHWFLSLRGVPAGSLVSITQRGTRWFTGFYHSERYLLVHWFLSLREVPAGSLVFQGYKYVINQRGRDGRIFWRCTKSRSCDCGMTTIEDEIISVC